MVELRTLSILGSENPLTPDFMGAERLTTPKSDTNKSLQFVATDSVKRPSRSYRDRLTDTETETETATETETETETKTETETETASDILVGQISKMLSKEAGRYQTLLMCYHISQESFYGNSPYNQRDRCCFSCLFVMNCDELFFQRMGFWHMFLSVVGVLRFLISVVRSIARYLFACFPIYDFEIFMEY